MSQPQIEDLAIQDIELEVFKGEENSAAWEDLYVETIRQGLELPIVTVFLVDNKYQLASFPEVVAAGVCLQLPLVKVEIRKGSLADAVLYSVAPGLKHSPTTQKGIRRNILRLLQNPVFSEPELSNESIARYTGSMIDFVELIRQRVTLK